MCCSTDTLAFPSAHLSQLVQVTWSPLKSGTCVLSIEKPGATQHLLPQQPLSSPCLHLLTLMSEKVTELWEMQSPANKFIQQKWLRKPLQGRGQGMKPMPSLFVTPMMCKLESGLHFIQLNHQTNKHRPILKTWKFFPGETCAFIRHTGLRGASCSISHEQKRKPTPSGESLWHIILWKHCSQKTYLHSSLTEHSKGHLYRICI